MSNLITPQNNLFYNLNESAFVQGDNAEDYIFCRECGTKIKATDKFCFKCGTPKPGEGDNVRAGATYEIVDTDTGAVAASGVLRVGVSDRQPLGADAAQPVDLLAHGGGHLGAIARLADLIVATLTDRAASEGARAEGPWQAQA